MMKLKELSSLYIRGMFMGMADIIPGVSGGTIALITGIYGRLLEAINAVQVWIVFTLKYLYIRENKKATWKSLYHKIPFLFLIPVILGIVSGIFFMSYVITYFLGKYQVYCYSFFFGIISASVYLLLSRLSHNKISILLFIIFTFLSFALLETTSPYSGDTSYILITVSGLFAICAMMLPGISGAYILLLLGQYKRIIKALHAFHWDILFAFILGAVAGILLFTRIVRYFLSKYYLYTMTALIGIMQGSLIKIWPYKYVPDCLVNYIYTSSILYSLFFIVLGVLIVYASSKYFTLDQTISA